MIHGAEVTPVIDSHMATPFYAETLLLPVSVAGAACKDVLVLLQMLVNFLKRLPQTLPSKKRMTC